jgi:KipI family sensor histidine kinase inhibitor
VVTGRPGSVRGRALGDRAVLLECEDPDQVRGVYAAACRRRDAGELSCLDVVPAAETVLLDGLADPGEVLATLADWEVGDPDDLVGEVVELPVVYDGPDLESVARLTGLEVTEVVRRHREAEFVVAFCGFAPGFAYLTGLPAELHVPRLEEPRTSVPAGSVGLAGAFTGVYPRSSPGGWQLVARTEERLWDLDREPPALLTPGTRVRFTDG